LLGRPGERQPQGETGASLNLIAGEIALVLTRDAACNREAEAASGRSAGRQPDESVEDPFAFCGGHAGAVVLDAQPSLTAILRNAQPHVARWPGGGDGVLQALEVR